MKEIPLYKKIISYLTRFLGVFLILFSLLALTNAFILILSVNKDSSSGIRFQNMPEAKDYFIVETINENYPAVLSGISPGDTVVMINGISVKERDSVRNILNKTASGNTVTYTVRNGSEIKNYYITFIPLTALEKFIIMLFRIVPVLMLISYAAVGFWGLVKSPYSDETILIALFCFCFGSFMYATVNTGYTEETFINKYFYFESLRTFISYLMWFAPSFWMLLFAYFPMKNRVFEKNKFVSLVFIFLLPIIILISDLLDISNPIIYGVIFSLLFTQMGIGVLLLSNNSKKLTSALEKRQIRLMLFGIKYGAIFIGIGWVFIIFTQFIIRGKLSQNAELIVMLIFLICEIIGLIIPFTFLNSFFQNKLLETENALKKQLRIFTISVVVLAIYFFAVFVIVRNLVSLFQMQDPTVIIITVLLISLTFTPINKRILNWIDETFYPEKTKYTASLKNYINSISGKIDVNELLDELKNWIETTFRISPVLPVVIVSENKTPFRPSNSQSVIHRIKNGSKFYWDEISERSRITVDDDEIEWVRNNNISVTVPMISQNEVIGAVNLGKKQNDEDYTEIDLDFITQASAQTALAVHNLKLQDVYLEKKRLDKELEVAKKIQQRLMPQEIPQIPGLDVYAQSKPCFEVAGDYFDIIKTEENNYFFVVADVSGKGAGAALIMANLQASIRVGLELTLNFSDFVEKINNHVYANTASSEFITLFIGVWEPEKGMFHYINAGHNPPIMLNSNDEVKFLESTGLLLGVLENQKYERVKFALEDNTLILIYSDGLEELMNQKQELFGQERITELLKLNKEKSSKEIVKKIMQSAEEFAGGKSFQDDLTMILIKKTT
jgi:sigma-B regulation protein RsbU (phosphoserine phosphatase)